MDFEARVCFAVDQTTARYREKLEKIGLRLDFKGIVGDHNSDLSEARIAVYEGSNLVDSLEFFVRRMGTPAVTPSEVVDWLTEQIEQLIAEHPWGGGWEDV